MARRNIIFLHTGLCPRKVPLQSYMLLCPSRIHIPNMKKSFTIYEGNMWEIFSQKNRYQCKKSKLKVNVPDRLDMLFWPDVSATQRPDIWPDIAEHATTSG